MWTDSHCHAQFEGLGLPALARAREAGVSRVVCVGTDARQSLAAVDLARAVRGGVWATVGLHPHDAVQEVDSLVGLLDERWPEVVAIGECGLDYHYDHSPRPVQRDAFAAQVALAHRHDLALVVHTRAAWDDTFVVLAAEGVPDRTVFHCFSGGAEEARRALDLGAWLSFSGIVTFKNADDVRAAAAVCPLDRLLVETDAPYLAPVPHRGRPNQPAYLPAVGAGVAATMGVAREVIEQASSDNAAAVFRLSPALPPAPAGPAPPVAEM